MLLQLSCWCFGGHGSGPLLCEEGIKSRWAFTTCTWGFWTSPRDATSASDTYLGVTASVKVGATHAAAQSGSDIKNYSSQQARFCTKQ